MVGWVRQQFSLFAFGSHSLVCCFPMGFGLASRGPRALYQLASFVTGIRGWPRCAVQGSQKSTLDPRLYSLLYIYIYIYERRLFYVDTMSF